MYNDMCVPVGSFDTTPNIKFIWRKFYSIK